MDNNCPKFDDDSEKLAENNPKKSPKIWYWTFKNLTIQNWPNLDIQNVENFRNPKFENGPKCSKMDQILAVPKHPKLVIQN